MAKLSISKAWDETREVWSGWQVADNGCAQVFRRSAPWQSQADGADHGESGTGRSSREPLNRQARASTDFSRSYGAMPKSIEAELLGKERGASPARRRCGAAASRQAKAEALYDEIGICAGAQTRLLRVLSDGNFYRVGGHSDQGNVRVIAGDAQDIETRVAKVSPRRSIPRLK